MFVSGNRQRAKTHCKYGHPFSGETLYLRVNGARGCRACTRQRNAQRKRQKKVERIYNAAMEGARI